MLLQTNSYIVPREKREEHARLLRKFRQVLLRLGCEHFEVYEQVGTDWAPGDVTGRYVQMLWFKDRKHQQTVQAAEKSDKNAQSVIQEFCALINFPYQQQHGLFASGFYQGILMGSSNHPVTTNRPPVSTGTKPPSSPAGFRSGATNNTNSSSHAPNDLAFVQDDSENDDLDQDIAPDNTMNEDHPTSSR
ncbi:MAG: hypothetical protein IT448_11885 [Phycisphaerales bacterium]|nr:hypothetical protein [Phycisphaerales bacterium]